jgi:uncharacterized membrane protein YfcA
MLLFFLCAFSLLTGFVDSVVGGGGLIQIPAMLMVVVTALIAKLAQSVIAP